MARDRRAAIRSAERLVARGKLEAAVKEYRKVLRAKPDDTNTLNRVGDLYARLNRLNDAVEIFSRAAQHFIEEGFLVKAIAIYKKIIRLDPTRIGIYETLADLYHRQGLQNEARSQYQVVADYYVQAGDASKVQSISERIVELEPHNPSHRVKLAELYCEAGMLSEALDQYQSIAAFMLDHDRVEEALRVYAGAFELSPGDLGFLTDVVLHLVDGGHPEAAERLLSRAEQKNPDASRVRTVTGLGGSVAAASVADVGLEPAPDAGFGPAPDGQPVVEPEPELSAPVEPPEPEPQAAAVPEPDRPTAPAPRPEEDVEEEVVVLDLDHGADDLPYAAAPAGGAATGEEEVVLEELEIDLEALEGGLDDGAEPPAALVEPELESADQELDETVSEAVSEAPGDMSLEAEEVEPSLAEADGETGLVEEPEAKVEAEVEALTQTELEPEPGVEPEPEPEPEEVAEAERVATLEEEPEAQELLAELEAAEESEAGLEPSEEEAVGEDLVTEIGSGPVEAEAPVIADLLVEARVLSTYGLSIKAADLCGRILEIERHNADALRLLVEIQHDEGDVASAAETAQRLRQAPGADVETWPVVEQWLADEGYAIREEGIEAPASEDASEQTAAPVTDEAEDEPTEALEVEPVAWESTGPGWLEEEASKEQSFAETEDIFGGEDEFFDLAAELEQELQHEEQRLGEGLPQIEEQSLEEIVEGFKRGVAETLSDEDHETHYNLGIAYREMGLVDEAIGEFQLAAKSVLYLVDCCSLLGSCFLEKGFPDLAIKWYERGLEAPQATENESLGLLYELGNLYVITGDREAARKTFAEIYGVNSNYRDVVAKLEEFKEG